MRLSVLKFLLLFGIGFLAYKVPGQPTAFTYQGVLRVGTLGANGNYDIRFAVWNAENAGSILAGPVTNLTVPVTNGIFTTSVDFGSFFITDGGWLELATQTSNGNGFTTLAPRQSLTSVPYSGLANSAKNLLGPISLAQLPPGTLTNGATAVNLSGIFAGNGNALSNLNASQIAGMPLQAQWAASGGGAILQKLLFGNAPVRGLFLGDSMSDLDNAALYSAGFFLGQKLRGLYGDVGVSLNSFDFSYGNPNCWNQSRPEDPHFFCGNEDAVVYSSDGPNAVKTSQNLTARGSSVPVNQVGVYYMQWPKGGTITLLHTNSVIGSETFVINGNNPDGTNVAFASWPCAWSTNNAFLITSSSGTNIVLGGEFIDNTKRGFLPIPYARSGSSLVSTINGPGTNCMATLFKAINPDFAIWHAKDYTEEDDVTLSNLLVTILGYSQLAGGTNTAVFVVGTPPNTFPGPADTSVQQNTIERNIALEHAALGYIYLDLFAQFPSYDAMEASGVLQVNGPHPTPEIGAPLWAATLAKLMGLIVPVDAGSVLSSSSATNDFANNVVRSSGGSLTNPITWGPGTNYNTQVFAATNVVWDSRHYTATNGDSAIYLTSGPLLSKTNIGNYLEITNNTGIGQYQIVDVASDGTYAIVADMVGYDGPMGVTNSQLELFPNSIWYPDNSGANWAGSVGNDGSIVIAGFFGTSANSGRLIFANGTHSAMQSVLDAIAGVDYGWTLSSISNKPIMTVSLSAPYNTFIIRNDGSLSLEHGITNRAGTLQLLGPVSAPGLTGLPITSLATAGASNGSVLAYNGNSVVWAPSQPSGTVYASNIVAGGALRGLDGAALTNSPIRRIWGDYATHSNVSSTETIWWTNVAGIPGNLMVNDGDVIEFSFQGWASNAPALTTIKVGLGGRVVRTISDQIVTASSAWGIDARLVRTNFAGGILFLKTTAATSILDYAAIAVAPIWSTNNSLAVSIAVPSSAGTNGALLGAGAFGTYYRSSNSAQ